MKRYAEPQRRILDHEINRLNRQILITADGRGPGGASHNYELSITSAPDSTDYPIGADSENLGSPVKTLLDIPFQDGPAKEVGINGFTEEALIAIAIDRLRGYQKGPYSCRENACAITHFEEGLMWLQNRSNDRERRGVEGSMQA